uniref:Uncharacterized protein n=1 Tax=Ananas comosus var. bracteatus TaxID=296719 RepID=A0A6V7PXS5_ANACO|nr:unnamed protein product [Ananas comosus var. bracteatus]
MALFHHLLIHSPFPKLEQYPPTCRSLRKPVCRNLSLACSGEQPREKAKSSRRTKSDKEVCNELREFMSVIGLPENRVPMLKDLSEHGRKDLANIVRRRGYKAITKLLLSSNANDSEYSDENHERNNSAEDKNSGREVTAPIVTAEYVFFSSDSPVMDEDTFNSNGTIFANSNAVVHKSSDSSVNILHSKAAKFIQTGELDDLEAIVVSQPVTPSIEDKFHKRKCQHKCKTTPINLQFHQSLCECMSYYNMYYKTSDAIVMFDIWIWDANMACGYGNMAILENLMSCPAL